MLRPPAASCRVPPSVNPDEQPSEEIGPEGRAPDKPMEPAKQRKQHEQVGKITIHEPFKAAQERLPDLPFEGDRLAAALGKTWPSHEKDIAHGERACESPQQEGQEPDV